MSQSMISVYRSARPNVRADRRIDTAVGAIPPGLVAYAAADPFGDERMADQVGAELGATKARLDDPGNYWMLEHPAHARAVLQWFWASL